MDDWKRDLHYFFRPEDDHRLDEPRAQASRFIQNVVVTAFADVARELASYGRELRTSSHDTSATAVVRHRGQDEFTFTVEAQILPDGVVQPLVTAEYTSRKGSSRGMFKAQTHVNGQTVADLTQDDIALTFTRQYLNSMRDRAQHM